MLQVNNAIVLLISIETLLAYINEDRKVSEIEERHNCFDIANSILNRRLNVNNL